MSIFSFLNKKNETMIKEKVSPSHIEEASIKIANQYANKQNEPQIWNKTYNMAFTSMYACSLYLGYKFKEEIVVSDSESKMINNILNTYISLNAPKKNIENSLIRLLIKNRLNQTEQRICLN